MGGMSERKDTEEATNTTENRKSWAIMDFEFSDDYGTPAWVRRVEEAWRKEKGTRTDL